MTCDEAETLLHALIDGELDAGHAREVEDHIAGCPRCAADLAVYREMSKAVAAADLRYTAPLALRRRIEASLPQATPAPNRRAVLRGFAMGSAVSAMAATGLVAIVLRNDDTQRVESEVVSGRIQDRIRIGWYDSRHEGERLPVDESDLRTQARLVPGRLTGPFRSDRL